MGDAIGATLGYAAGIAVSPIPIAAVILVLFSGRARVNGDLHGATTRYLVCRHADGVAAHQLNGRPRQTLNWMTPSQKLAEASQ
ncbi:hypothetical protein ACFLQ7_01280 [Actinomycetota bacterium]